MIQRWQTLQNREKWVIAIGAAVTILLLIDNYIYSPLSQLVEQQRQQLNEQYQLHQALINIQKKHIMMHQTKAMTHLSTNAALSASIENSLSQHKLSHYLSSLQELQTAKIKMHFSRVPFDSFIQWLQSYLHKSHLKVVQISIQRIKQPGYVRVVLTLGK